MAFKFTYSPIDGEGNIKPKTHLNIDIDGIESINDIFKLYIVKKVGFWRGYKDGKPVDSIGVRLGMRYSQIEALRRSSEWHEAVDAYSQDEAVRNKLKLDPSGRKQSSKNFEVYAELPEGLRAIGDTSKIEPEIRQLDDDTFEYKWTVPVEKYTLSENEECLKEYLNVLNPSQLRAVTQSPGVLLILAGPGSGKTRVLTTRIAHLVKQQDIKPNRCRAITFTRAATTEMRERLSRLGVEGVLVSTIHGLAREIIDKFYRSHPDLMQMCSAAKRTAPLCWIDGMDESRYPIFKTLNGDTYPVTPENCLYLALGHVVYLAKQGLDKTKTSFSFSWQRSLQNTKELKLIDELLNTAKTATQRRFWERLASYVSLFHLKKYVKNVLGHSIRASLDPEDLSEIHKILSLFLEQYSMEFQDFLDSVALIYKSLIETKGLIDYTGQLLWVHKILQHDEESLAKAQDLYEAYFVDEFQDTDLVQFDTLRLLSEQYRNITVVGDPNQAIYGFRGADDNGIRGRFQETFPDANKVSLEVNYRSTQQIIDASYAVVADYQHDDWVRCRGEKEGSLVRFIQRLNEIESYPFNFTVLTRTNKGAKEIGLLLQQDGVLYKMCTRDNPRPHLGIPSWRVIPVVDILRAAEDFDDVQRILAAIQHVKGVGKKTMTRFRKDPAAMWMNPNTTEVVAWLAKGIPSVSEIYTSKKLKLYIDYLKQKEKDAETEYLTKILDQFANCPTYADLLAKASVEIRTIHSAKGLEFPVVVVDLKGFKPWDHSDEELAEECRVLYVAMSRAEQELYLLGSNPQNFPNLETLEVFIRTQQETIL
ncbi:MAG: ATP-dependent helicase [Candidatus Poribacteria bacterium]|nr:ATP-dependent helicase [Candidatus Poribacteria bacterium]